MTLKAIASDTGVKQQQLFGPEPLPWELADQEDLACAQLVFNRPVDKAFDYVIPDALRGQLQVGQRVKAPFGRGERLAVGYCVGLEKPKRTEGLKGIHSLVDTRPLLSPRMLTLTRWIADRYLCAWGQVLETVVPAGVKNRAGTREVLMLQINAEVCEANKAAKLPPKQQAVMQVLSAAEKPLPLDHVARLANCGTAPITALRRKRFVRAFAERTEPTEPDLAPTKLEQDLQAQKRLQALDKALLAAHSGDFEGAVEFFEEALSFSPNAADLYVDYSALRVQQAKLPEAKALAEKALQLAPNNTAAHSALVSAIGGCGRNWEGLVMAKGFTFGHIEEAVIGVGT
jgi:hypothetical protein